MVVSRSGRPRKCRSLVDDLENLIIFDRYLRFILQLQRTAGSYGELPEATVNFHKIAFKTFSKRLWNAMEPAVEFDNICPIANRR